MDRAQRAIIRKVNEQTQRRQAEIEARAAALPPEGRRAFYEQQLAALEAEHRRGAWKVVLPIVASLALFFGVVIAMNEFRDAVHLSIGERKAVIAALVAQMVAVLVLVLRPGVRSGATRNLVVWLRQRLRST